MKNFKILYLFFLSTIGLFAQDKFKSPLSKFDRKSANINLGKISIKLPESNGLQVNKDDNGQTYFIKGKVKTSPNTKYARGSAESVAFGYLEAIKGNLSITKPESEFRIIKTEIDDLNKQHIRLSQHYNGLPIYGAEVIVHSNGNEADMLNGRFFPTPTLKDLKPTIDTKKALEIIKNDLKNISIFKDLSALEQSIMKYSAPKTELIIYHENDDISKEKLTWQVEIRPNLVERWQYFVDAKTGKIISKFNHTCAIDGPATATAADLNGISRSIKTYQSGNSFILVDASRPMFKGGAINTDDPQGVLWTIDASNTTPEELNVKQVASSNNTWTNKTAVSAHYNAGLAYEYYLNKHGRNSLNGKGGSIISIINITETDEKTGKVQQMDNAFWNGEFMGYGNGNTFFKPLAGGLDVAGHEMTHGVIENTANLNYQGQSGAINESMADVFGVLIDRTDGDFNVGEDVVKNGAFLRSLSDPNKGDQPASMSQLYTGSEDNGGVHINSGIPNRAFYLFVKGLSGTEEQQKTKAEKVYYRALTTYLTRSSKFVDLRAAIVQSCKDLAATVGAEAEAAANAAFSTVGIGGSGATTTPPTQKPVEDLPVNAGSEFVLSYDPCQKAIYSSKEVIQSDADYRILVKDVIIDHKPSITDDGSFAYFIAKKEVGGGGILTRVNLVGTPKVEALDDQENWANVAVSKDGKKLALNTIFTTANDQKKIFIVDLEKGTINGGFTLYNPTYSETLRSAGTPLYSDALEWEYNGEYVIYDAFNQIKTSTLVEATTSSSIDYWDVGALKGWDNTNKTFGDGKITKLFSNLEKNESIGNPSFAKRSTSVIAFDRILNNKNSILTVDFESKGADGGYKKFEIQNNTIGFPEFSAKDDKLIFNRLVTKQKQCPTDSTNTASVSLASDKVTATGSGNAEFIVTSGLAVWYTVGKRELPTTQSGQVIAFPAVGTKIEGATSANSTIDLPSKTDKETPITYKVVSGPASIVNGKIVLTGKPGRVRVQGNANATANATAVEQSFDFCINPVKPTIAITDLANAILLQSSDDYTNEWFADGVLKIKDKKGIEVTDTKSYTLQTVVDGCRSEVSAPFKAGATETQKIAPISFSDRLQGSISVLELPSKTDKDNNVTYSVVSGPATISGNKLSLTGNPGRVVVKGFSPAGLKYSAAEISFEFCVNPSKPTISIKEEPDQFIFTSSALTGNNWYRNNVALNVTDRSINVVSTNNFTVQVVIDGCKSEFSDIKKAPKEIVLGEEPLAKLGVSVYPNPITNILNIDSNASLKIASIQITDTKGAILFEKSRNINQKEQIQLVNIPKGIVILKLSTTKGEFSKKLLKE
jgi:bacillolysin